LYTARITIQASRLSAGVVNFDTSSDVIISAADTGAPVSRAILRVVRGPGVYGSVNVVFRVVSQTSNTAGGPVMHITPSNGVVTLLDRQVQCLILPSSLLLHSMLLLCYKFVLISVFLNYLVVIVIKN